MTTLGSDSGNQDAVRRIVVAHLRLARMYEQLEKLSRIHGDDDRAQLYASRLQAHLDDPVVADLKEYEPDDDPR